MSRSWQFVTQDSAFRTAAASCFSLHFSFVNNSYSFSVVCYLYPFDWLKSNRNKSITKISKLLSIGLQKWRMIVLSFRLIQCIKTKVWFRQFDSRRTPESREGKIRTRKIKKMNNRCIIDYGGHQAMFWNTITKFCACWTWNNPTRENILFRTFFSVLVGANWQQKPHICVK